MAFATKPVREWNQTDVQHWLRAGFSADCAAMGWTQKLSHDYTALFHACDFDDCGAEGVLPAKPMCTVTSVGKASPTFTLGTPRSACIF